MGANSLRKALKVALYSFHENLLKWVTLMSAQVFFIIPCVDIYEKIDMRTATYEIPPQEVTINIFSLVSS